MADEKALFVVVGVDEPTGDAVGIAAFDFAGLRLEYVNAIEFYAILAVFLRLDGNIRLAEDDEQIALAGVLQVVRPCASRRSYGPFSTGTRPSLLNSVARAS